MNRLVFVLGTTGALLLSSGFVVLLALRALGPDRIAAHAPRDSRVAALEGRIAEIESRPPVTLYPLTEQLDRLRERVAAVERRSRTRAKRIAEVARSVDALRRNLEIVAARPLPKPVDLAPVNAAVSALRRELAALAAEAKPVPQRFDVLERRFADLALGTETLRKETESLRSETMALAERTQEFASRQVASPVDVRAAEAAIAKVEEGVAGLSHKYDGLVRDVESLRHGLETVERRTRELADRPVPAPVDLSPLDRAVAKLGADLAEMRERAAMPAAATVADHDRRLDALEDQIVRLRRMLSDLRLDLSILRGQQRNP